MTPASDHDPRPSPPARHWPRLLAGVVGLVAGITALVIAILLVRGVLL